MSRRYWLSAAIITAIVAAVPVTQTFATSYAESSPGEWSQLHDGRSNHLYGRYLKVDRNPYMKNSGCHSKYEIRNRYTKTARFSVTFHYQEGGSGRWKWSLPSDGAYTWDLDTCRITSINVSTERLGD